MSDVTRILEAVEAGDPRASAELLPIVYAELRQLAAAQMARERPDHTLNATALVHEAYLRLVAPHPGKAWDGRAHFYNAAAEAMRRILIENARRRHQIKRGGDLSRQHIDPDRLAHPEPDDNLEALSEALDKLAKTQPQAAQLIQLRYFAGLSLKDAAATLGIAPRTADSYWAYARAWLLAELRGEED